MDWTRTFVTERGLRYLGTWMPKHLSIYQTYSPSMFYEAGTHVKLELPKPAPFPCNAASACASVSESTCTEPVVNFDFSSLIGEERAFVKPIEIYSSKNKAPTAEQNEDLEVSRLGRQRPLENKFFVSDDKDENDDINDPDWRIVRCLSTDEERREFAMREFGNLEPCDPTKPLTFHGFRRQRIRQKKGIFSRPSSFNYKIENVNVVDGRVEIRGRAKKRRASGQPDGESLAKRPRFYRYGEFEALVEDVFIDAKRKYADDIFYAKRHFHMASAETKKLYEYRSGSSLVSAEEVEKFKCIEDLFVVYNRYYGPNRVDHCKECSSRDNKHVRHSL